MAETDKRLTKGATLGVCSRITSLLSFMGSKSIIIVRRKELNVVLGWPWNVSDEFLEFLRARYPAVMAILLYSCITM